MTFTTEGLADYRDKEVIRYFVGNYDYSPDLIDYYLYWGKLPAKTISKELISKGRMRDKDQVRVFGNPMYEKDKLASLYSNKGFVRSIHNRKDMVIVLTGFNTSEYTIQDIINAQDLVNTDGKSRKQILEDLDLKKALQSTKEQKMYCQKYIDTIIKTAEENKDILFVVKLHPSESLVIKERKKLPYINRLKGISNILVVYKSFPIGLLLPYCKLLIHYGSTVDLESYIYNVPTLRLRCNFSTSPFALNFFANKLTDSTYYANVDDVNGVSKYVRKAMDGEIRFKKNAVMERQLYEFMNYKEGCIYNPSEKMASFLCSNLHRNKVQLTFSEWKELLIHIRKLI